MIASGASQVDLVVPASVEFEPLVIQTAAGAAMQLGFPASRIEDVKTIVGEAFVNAVEHGSRFRVERRVTLRFFLVEQTLRVEISDLRAGFDPQRVAEPNLKLKMQGQSPPRGWGLFLIRRLANRLEVRRRFPFRSCLSLTIDRNPVQDSRNLSHEEANSGSN